MIQYNEMSIKNYLCKYDKTNPEKQNNLKLIGENIENKITLKTEYLKKTDFEEVVNYLHSLRHNENIAGILNSLIGIPKTNKDKTVMSAILVQSMGILMMSSTHPKHTTQDQRLHNNCGLIFDEYFKGNMFSSKPIIQKSFEKYISKDTKNISISAIHY